MSLSPYTTYHNTPKTYEIAVLEVKPKDPSKSVSIIECDMQVDIVHDCCQLTLDSWILLLQ